MYQAELTTCQQSVGAIQLPQSKVSSVFMRIQSNRNRLISTPVLAGRTTGDPPWRKRERDRDIYIYSMKRDLHEAYLDYYTDLRTPITSQHVHIELRNLIFPLHQMYLKNLTHEYMYSYRYHPFQGIRLLSDK